MDDCCGSLLVEEVPPGFEEVGWLVAVDPGGPKTVAMVDAVLRGEVLVEVEVVVLLGKVLVEVEVVTPPPTAVAAVAVASPAIALST